MKVCIICVGSRGDAEPFCALSAKLIDQGHSVEFFCQPELQSFIPKSTSTDGTVTVTVTVHSLPFTQFDFYKYAGSPSKGTDHPNVRVRFVGAVADIIAELVLPCYEQVLPVAKTCQVMVTSALARNLCFALTEQLSIPTVLVHLQSLVPTKLYPHASNAEDCLASLDKFWSHASLTEEEASKNEESYWFLEQFQHEFVQDALNDLYSKLQIPPLTWDENRKILSGHHPQIYLANSFYDELIPATPKALTDVGPQLHYVGALADHYIPVNFIPNAQLQSFLDQENTKKTICIGYGSMPYSQVSLLLEVVHQLKRRTVLVGKALELPKMMADKNNNDESDDKGASLDLDWIQTNVFQIDSAPYAWLLPQCSMMLCHGGAGVVHATLRAGIPVVVSPFIGDQFFYAPLVAHKGLGARAGASLATATKEDFLQAIETATRCIPAAREFGVCVRGSGDKNNNNKNTILGVDRMVQLLENKVVCV